LQAANSFLVPGFGIHPWKADTITPGWEDRLIAILKATQGSFVGETGLDGYRSTRPRGLSLEIQRKTFMPQLEIAAQLRKPIVLHCVKAWDFVIQYVKKTHVDHFAIHRFKGSPEQASEALRHGAYLSIHSDSLVHHQTVEAISRLPLNRILVESDWDGPRPDARPILEELAYVLKELARILGKSEEFLAQTTARNAREFYGIN
jgi:TatD DNase family protein